MPRFGSLAPGQDDENDLQRSYLTPDIGAAMPEAYRSDQSIPDPLVHMAIKAYKGAQGLIDLARQTPYGLRREDFTDIPGSEQPIDPLVKMATKQAVGMVGGPVIGRTAEAAPGAMTLGSSAIKRTAIKKATQATVQGGIVQTPEEEQAIRKGIFGGSTAAMIPGEHHAGEPPIPETQAAAAPQAPAPDVDWSKFNQPFGSVTDPGSKVVIQARDPRLNITQRDLDRSMSIASSVSGGGLATKGVGAAAAKAAAKEAARVAAERAPGAPLAAPFPTRPTVTSPLRLANPGVYQRPDVIAAQAAANVAPEHPALKELFGVNRQDLYDISQQGARKGNITPQLWTPSRPGPVNAASAAVMNPANAQRMIDTLTEAQKYPDLWKGMIPWYVMDPAYQQMAKLVGPARAVEEYNKLNMRMTPFSAGSPVPLEITRGSAANMMANRGRFPIFQQYGGWEPGARPPEAGEFGDVPGHLMHKNQADAVRRLLETGQHGYDPNTVKIPLYTQASGVPETGFQTTLPVPDTHFATAIGMPEARTMKDFNTYMGGPEYRPVGPWFRENVARPMGIEAVPGQSATWGVYGPQTGVKTPVGAGKLELMAQNIWEKARSAGIDPKRLRDDFLTGKSYAQWLMGGALGAGTFGSLGRRKGEEGS